jgi:hypothetical protein
MPNIRLKRYNGAAWENVEVQTDWSQILNKPSTFTPTSHSHTSSDLPSNTIIGTTFPGAFSAPGGGSNQGVILFGDYYGWHTRNIGTTGQVLTVANGVPTWQTPVGGADTANFLFNNTTGFSDANSIFKGGVYTYFNGTNVPAGDFGLISVPTWSGNNPSGRYNLQLGAQIGSSLYYRTTGVDGAGPWRIVWDQSNLTNLNQLSNGPGYITSSGTSEASNRNIVFDVRDTNKTPAEYASHRSIFEFNNNLSGGSSWWGVMTVKGWDGSYAAWQLAGPASVNENKDDLYFRGGQQSTWGDWRRIYHTGTRDITLSTSIGGNFGNRLIVGNTDTSFTLQDSNLRPTIHAHGAYPVLSLNHTVTGNTSHGPTVQFTANGTGNQFVIGMTGNGSRLDIGTSSNSSWNPHNGIADYLGITAISVTTSGDVGINTLSPTYKLDVVGGIRSRGSQYNRFDTWTDLPAHAGFFSSVHNSAHFLPNNGTYGSWKMQGSRNGWHGLEFENSNGNISLMINGNSTESGFHANWYGWQMYWTSGSAYVSKSTYGGGTLARIHDSSNLTFSLSGTTLTINRA